MTKTPKPAASKIKSMSYYLYAVLVEPSGEVQQASFLSDSPFYVPKIGDPMQVVDVSGSGLFSIVGTVSHVRYSYEFDPSNLSMVCNTNVTLIP